MRKPSNRINGYCRITSILFFGSAFLRLISGEPFLVQIVIGALLIGFAERQRLFLK